MTERQRGNGGRKSQPGSQTAAQSGSAAHVLCATARSEKSRYDCPSQWWSSTSASVGNGGDAVGERCVIGGDANVLLLGEGGDDDDVNDGVGEDGGGGDGGGTARGGQSLQSRPRGHTSYCEPGPPSSQMPSLVTGACTYSLLTGSHTLAQQSL